MSKFGWSYPAGAAGDPNAPWNQDYPDVRVLKDKVVTANKAHVCEFCQRPITAKTKYRYIVFKDYDIGKLAVTHQHIVCPMEEEWPWGAI